MKRSIYLITLAAFILRIALGLAASSLLPQVGYDSKPQQAGYLFFDAYRRDQQAWDLAQSPKPLMRAFEGKYASDQYGGLLWLSALIYRYFPGDTHQPLLIVFLAAAISSLGTLFVYLTVKRVDTEKTAFFAALIFAFLPEGILLGASQMREPFLMTLLAMTFYGLVEWQHSRKLAPWIWIGIGLAGMLIISPGIVLVALAVSFGWLFFADTRTGGSPVKKVPWPVIAGAAALFGLTLVLLAASWDSLVATRGNGILGTIGGWARETTQWNAYLLKRSSGIVQLLFQALPPILALPFVAIYGILQPVLPAVLLEPGISFWQILGTLRAAGWYLLLPLIAFAPLNNWITIKTQPQARGARQWFWLSLVVWGWILIAALRGGGDQWDNPRYRVIILAWLAILAAQTLEKLSTAPKSLSRWFWRICAVELIILIVFGHWYSWRYLGIGINLGIRNTLVIAIGLSAIGVLGDWLWQRYRRSSLL